MDIDHNINKVRLKRMDINWSDVPDLKDISNLIEQQKQDRKNNWIRNSLPNPSIFSFEDYSMLYNNQNEFLAQYLYSSNDYRKMILDKIKYDADSDPPDNIFRE